MRKTIKCGQCQNEIIVSPENRTMLYSHWYVECGRCGHIQRFDESLHDPADYKTVVTIPA